MNHPVLAAAVATLLAVLVRRNLTVAEGGRRVLGCTFHASLAPAGR